MRQIIDDTGLLASAPDPTGDLLEIHTLSLNPGLQAQLRSDAEGHTVWLEFEDGTGQPEPDDFDDDVDEESELELVLQGNYPFAIWGDLAGDLARGQYELLIQQLLPKPESA